MTVGFAVFLAILLGSLCWLIGRVSEDNAKQHATLLLNGAADRLAFEIAQEHQIDLRDFLAEERSFAQEPLSVLVLDPDGKLVKKSSREVPLDMEQHPDDWRTVRRPAGKHELVLGFAWKRTRLALERQSQALFALAGVSTLVGAFAAWILVGRVLRPIHLLSLQARRAQPLESPSADAEMRELVDTLNSLLHRVAQGVAARGRFYAAASHELRTPRQGLLGHLELALSRPRTAEYYEQALREVFGQTTRLTDLVRALLLLNQIEVSSPPAEPVDLPTVVESQLKGRSLGGRRLEITGEGIVQAPLSHLEMLVGNLLDNAIKYSPEGSTLTLAMACEGLTLVNPTAETVQWDEARLFEPFYRTDQSRNSRTGGNGLGLTICRSVADANGWQLGLKAADCQVVAEVAFQRRDP